VQGCLEDELGTVGNHQPEQLLWAQHRGAAIEDLCQVAIR
jgi:hypothetical protein